MPWWTSGNKTDQSTGTSAKKISCNTKTDATNINNSDDIFEDLDGSTNQKVMNMDDDDGIKEPLSNNNDDDDDDNNNEEDSNNLATTTVKKKGSNKRRKDLSDSERTEIMNFLLINYQDGKLKKASIRKAAAKFKLHRNTVGTIWRRAKKDLQEGSTSFDVSSRKKKNGRKPKNWDAEIENIKNIPASEKLSLRRLSRASNIPKTTLHKLIKEKKIQRISKNSKSLAHSYLRITNDTITTNTNTTTTTTNDDTTIIHKNSSPEMKELFQSIQKLDSNQIMEVQEFINSRYFLNNNHNPNTATV